MPLGDRNSQKKNAGQPCDSLIYKHRSSNYLSKTILVEQFAIFKSKTKHHNGKLCGKICIYSKRESLK